MAKNPGLQAALLVEKIRGKTCLSRSTVFEHLGSFGLQGKLYRDRGRYWLEKPSAHTPGLVSRFTNWLERRAETKKREQERLRRAYVAPALAHFRHRAEVDGVRFWKYIVEEESHSNR